MRRRARGERTPLNAEINVVSLIDVMMLLMIIFMITAPMMQGGVDVSLPRAEARPLDAKRPLVVSITRDGRIYLDEVRVSLGEFRSMFRALAARSGQGGSTCGRISAPTTGRWCGCWRSCGPRGSAMSAS